MHGDPDLTDWQQLAAAVMAEPSTAGSNAAGSAGGGAGALHSASGGAACTRPATGSGAAAEQAAPPRGAVWPLSPPKLQQQLPERGGARGQELTVGDLVALRRRHRLPSVAPAPAGALEVGRGALRCMHSASLYGAARH